MISNYFTISKCSDPKYIGVKNGLYQVNFDENSFESSIEYEKFQVLFYRENFFKTPPPLKSIDINIKNLFLLPRAKVTDVMGFAPFIPFTKFIVSEKVKKSFEKFKLPEHLFKITNVVNRKTKERYAYYFFYIPSLSLDEIIFDKSELFVKKLNDSGNWEKQYYKINDEKHYDILKNELLTPEFSKICLSPEYECFDCVAIDGKIFVSGVLKQALDELNVTGCQFGSATSLVFA